MNEDASDFTLIVPDDVLCSIFSLVQLNEPIPHHPLDNKQPPGEIDFGWIRITYVNRRWRQVAVDDAILWTRLTSKLGARWLDEFVRRSKSAPLSVNDHDVLDVAPREYDTPQSAEVKATFIKILVAHRGRIASLRLHMPINDHVTEAFAGTLSTLEELFIDGIILDSAEIDTIQLAHMILQRAPHLRNLYLVLPRVPTAALDWTHTTWNGLTSLNLVLGGPEAGDLLIPNFLNALRCMPSMTELGVRENGAKTNPLVCDYHCSGTHDDLIFMRNLRSLILEGPMETHAHLLRHVSLPSRARLALSCAVTASSAKTVHDALRYGLINWMNSHQELSAFEAAYISSLPSTEGTTVTLGLDYDPQPRPPSNTILLYDEFPHEHNISQLSFSYRDTKASSILPFLPVKSLRTLTLYNAYSSEARIHSSFFPGIERLRFRVAGMSLMSGINFLEDRNVLPSLRLVDLDEEHCTLALVMYSFSRTPRDLYHEPFAVAEGFPVLENILQARRDMGSPLQAIFLHIEEDIALVRQGRIAETSCKHLDEKIVRLSIPRLESIEGLRFVRKDFDPFAGA